MNKKEFAKRMNELKSGEEIPGDMLAYMRKSRSGMPAFESSVLNEDGTISCEVADGATAHRAVLAFDEIELRAKDSDDFDVQLSFSSENPVMRWGENEILSHEKGDADFSRLKKVGSILLNHDPDQIVGRPTEVWLDEGQKKGRLKMVFGTDADGINARHKVMTDKTLRGISVGYTVESYVFLKDASVTYKGRIQGPGWVASRWSALEASLTPIPADGSVGINRTVEKIEKELDEMSKQFKTWLEARGMDVKVVEADAAKRAELEAEFDLFVREKVKTPAPAPVTPPAPVTETPEAREQRAIVAERERSASITELCTKFGVEASQRDAMIRDGSTVDQANAKVLEILKKSQGPVGGKIRIISDGIESFARAGIEAIGIKQGKIASRDAKHGGNTIAGRSMKELARECLERRNIDVPENVNDMIDAALRGPRIRQSDIDRFLRSGEIISGTSSDFPFILAATANKSMLDGFNDEITSYEQYCYIGNLSDFKAAQRISMTEVGDLQRIYEGGKYPQTALGEDKNTIQVYTYGLKFNISRQAIIDDDMSVFTRLPASMGSAARRLPNILAARVLLANAAMNDTLALFSIGHYNIATGASQALDTAAHAYDGIIKIGSLLSEQRGRLHAIAAAESETLYLNLPLRKVLVASFEQQVMADTVLTSSANPSQTNPGVNNAMKGKAVSVLEPLLKDSHMTGYSTTAFYGVSDVNRSSPIEVAFLNGQREPFMEEVDQTDADGRAWKVRLDVGAAAVSHLGMVKHTGAA